MSLRFVLLLAAFVFPAMAGAERPLPPLYDGVSVAGPGEFRHDGQLLVQGSVVLKNMTLDLHGPIRVAAGARLELDDVQLKISDPNGAPNGTSGLTCAGPAHIVVRRSSMVPVGDAHPMWLLKGDLAVEGFATRNSEFHLDHVQATLRRLSIFELEISNESRVTAHGLDLVFLSTHSGEDDHLQFRDIPTDRSFTQTLTLGSGARADLADVRIQFFLLYIHGRTEASLAHMDRVQLAISPNCDGSLRLMKGRLGSDARPAVFPEPHTSTCPFRIRLNDVNVDTWDVYAGGQARLSLQDSQIDQLTAREHANIAVRDSTLYADWLDISGDASVTVQDSGVGALRLAGQRPDLATSQIRVSGHGRASFSGVRFDCGVVATDDGVVVIRHAVSQPKYLRRSGSAVITIDGRVEQSSSLAMQKP